MAIKIEQRKPLNAIQIVSELDDAIDMQASDWEEYKKTGDMSKLQFMAGKQPTIFLCNFAPKGHEASAIKDSMLGGRDDEGQPKLQLGSWSFKVVKFTLKDIQNPPDLPLEQQLKFKKDSQGYAHDDVVTELDRLGIVNEIFAMYTALTMGGARANAKN